MITFYIINIVIVAFTAFIGIRNRITAGRGQNSVNESSSFAPLNITNTLSLRAILMFLMISHHVSFKIGIPNVIQLFFGSIGGILTGAFFFLSGFGNKISYEKNYANCTTRTKVSWLLKKILGIVIPFEIILPFMYFTNSDDTVWGGVRASYLKYAFTLRFPGSGLFWFVKIIILCYLIFFISFFLTKVSERTMRIISGLLITSYIIIMIVFNEDKVWWSSILCFWCGIEYATHREKIDQFLKNKVVICILIVLLIFAHICSFLFSGILEILSAVLFSFFVIVVNDCFPIFDKRLINIGEASFEMYLIHSGFITTVFFSYSQLSNLQCLMVYLASYVGALAVHIVYKWIYKLLKRTIIKT